MLCVCVCAASQTKEITVKSIECLSLHKTIALNKCFHYKELYLFVVNNNIMFAAWRPREFVNKYFHIKSYFNHMFSMFSAFCDAIYL